MKLSHMGSSNGLFLLHFYAKFFAVLKLLGAHNCLMLNLVDLLLHLMLQFSDVVLRCFFTYELVISRQDLMHLTGIFDLDVYFVFVVR